MRTADGIGPARDLVLRAAFWTLLASCGGGTEPPPPPPAPSATTSTVATSSATVVSGSSATITLQVKDQNGANMTTGGLVVAFSLGGSGTSTGTIGAVTDNSNGTYTASFTGVLAGTAREVNATMGGAAVTTAAPTITVTPGAPSASTSTVASGSATVASGSTTTLTLTTKDAAGNSVTSGGATVAFALTSGGTSAGTIGAVTDNGNGTYGAVFTATTAGTARAIATTLNTAAVSTTAPSITVVPGPVSAGQSTAEVSPTSVTVGGTATLTVRARDAAGNAHTAGGVTVAFTKGAGTSDGTISTVVDNANGTYAATFSATTAGSARTIGATVNGTAITSTLPTITVTPAATSVGPISAATSVVTVSASSIASGTGATITLQAKDAAGTNLSTGGAAVAFSLGASGTSTGTIGGVTDNANGTYTATFTGVLAGTGRAIAATIDGTAVSTAAPTIAVTPGSASAATSVVTSGSATVTAGNTTTLTLTAKDAAGNSITGGGATVVFSLASSSGTSAGTIGGVTDNANGTYSATFTGTTAGSARAIAATINSSSVTTTAPSITVTPGAISVAKSTVTVSATKVKVTGTSTFTLTTRDAYDNVVTATGQSVAFALSGGTSAGTIGTVADNSNGTYAATFTASTVGTEALVGATLGGSAVTSTKPAIIVYTPGITFSSDSVVVNATTGQAASPHLVGVFANGGAIAAGVQATVNYVNNGISACTTTNWLGTPAFDSVNANPVSIITLSPTAASLGVYSCSATVTVSSTTPDVASRSFKVVIAVARGAVAQMAVNLVFMGNNGSDPNTTQNLIPAARILITNGGRGTVTGLHAFVDTARHSQVVGDTAWITASDLTWEPAVTDTNARTAPRTLVVAARVRPSGATATLRVTGTGMSPVYIPLNVLFNISPELVTNPRGIAFNAFAGSSSVQATALAFNQNRTVSRTLRDFRINTSVALPAWLTASAADLPGGVATDTAATITVTANPFALLPDNIYTDTVRVEANECCAGDGSVLGTKLFKMPVALVVERGLVVAAGDVTLFGAAGTTAVSKDIAITNGGSTAISGLAANFTGASWLSATFVGGTGAPTTLRLTANPTGLARGSVVSTTVTISASSPTGVPSKSIPVTFRVY